MLNQQMRSFWMAILCLPFLTWSVAAQDKKDADELPPAEQVTIDSVDGVQLKATWYAGTKGKESVPVILVHDWGADRSQLLPLAEHLQKTGGHAVIVPDLRGHGLSTSVAGAADSLDYREFKKAQIASVSVDIDTCKRFLMRKNNVGELNIELLTVVATHRTCIHAVNWAVSDWSWAPLPDGTKQGQDVKALVLISPVKRFKSLSMNAALKVPVMSGKNFLRPITVAILWGNQSAATDRDAISIYNALIKSRRDPAEIANDEKWDLQDLFRVPYSTDSVGGELFTDSASSKITDNIQLLINKKLAERSEDYRWQDRSVKN